MCRGLYLADLVTVIGTQDLVFVRLIASFYFMHRFYRGLFGIVHLYLILVLFLLLSYCIVYKISPLISMIILIIGVFVDKRFNLKSKIIIILLSIIQLLLYYYLELVPILLVKDLFWYSVVLNISFIWHVLILHWLFEISIYYKWDYGCYLLSRFSLITSLTGLFWIFDLISFLANWIDDYYHWVFNLKRASPKINNIEFIVLKFIFIIFLINLVISICKSIILYFMTVFNNYSLLLLGKNTNPLWKQPIKFYISFIIFFAISLYFMIPRIYVFWTISLIIKSIDVIYKTIVSRFAGGRWLFQFWFTVPQTLIIGDYLTEPGFNEHWGELYNKEYYLDYIIFCENLDWFFSNYYYERSPYNLYDIFEVFIYNKDRRIKIISNYCCLGAPDIPSECVTKYNLQIAEKDFIKLVLITKELPLIIKNASSARISLWNYIKLERGHYF